MHMVVSQRYTSVKVGEPYPPEDSTAYNPQEVPPEESNERSKK